MNKVYNRFHGFHKDIFEYFHKIQYLVNINFVDQKKQKKMRDISKWFINEDFYFLKGNWGIMYILTYWTFSKFVGNRCVAKYFVKKKKNSLHVLRVICLFGISLVLRRFVLISHWTNQIFHRKSGHVPIVVKFELLWVSELIWGLLTIRSTKSQHFTDSCVIRILSLFGLLETQCLQISILLYF